jgi:serine protease AprX
MVKNKGILRVAYVLAVLLFFSTDTWAQELRKHLIYFTDKNETPYSIDRPLEFLSERALVRRINQNIPLTMRDLPVSPAYLQEVSNRGAKVLFPTRWFNGAVILATDEVLQQVLDLPMVQSTERLTYHITPLQEEYRTGLASAGENELLTPDDIKETTAELASPLSYGFSAQQVSQLGADHMHAAGFNGSGKVVAVFDGGFHNVNIIPAFKHLYDDNRLLGTYDFVDRGGNVYDANSHGTNVLSCMAAFIPDSVIGTAYGASYYLFRTEEVARERRIEEANWLAAAERADSLGVDVINSSLGYNAFDDPLTNYSIEDLDGRTAIVTRAAHLAASVGILVVNSAGNSGLSPSWKGRITFPGDADSILTVGAVSADGEYVGFSSRGPTADERIKPDISALGQRTLIVEANGALRRANGTSFASPLAAGLATGLWQAYPELTAQDIISVLKQSGSQAMQPDIMLGWGIPSFVRATAIANELKKSRRPVLEKAQLYPTITNKEAPVLVVNNENFTKPMQVVMFDVAGRKLAEQTIPWAAREHRLQLPVGALKPGTYILHVSTDKGTQVLKFVKQ